MTVRSSNWFIRFRQFKTSLSQSGFNLHVSSIIHRSTINDTEFDRNRRRRVASELMHVFLLCLSATASRTTVAWLAFLKLFCSWQWWVSDQSEQTLTSYSAHSKSFWRQSFPGNHLTTHNVNDRRFASHKKTILRQCQMFLNRPRKLTLKPSTLKTRSPFSGRHTTRQCVQVVTLAWPCTWLYDIDNWPWPTHSQDQKSKIKQFI